MMKDDSPFVSKGVACVFPAFAMRYSDIVRGEIPQFEEIARPLFERAAKVVRLHPQKMERPETFRIDDPVQDALQSQFACYIDNYAAASLFREHYGDCQFAAAYSMGLFSALSFTGSVSFEDGLLLTERACEIAYEVSGEGPWGMSAVIGLTREQLAEVARPWDGTISISDRCGSRVFILSGKRTALEDMLDTAIDAGALNVKMLPVTLPFHDPSLAEATAPLREWSRQIAVAIPRCPILSATTQELLLSPESIRNEIATNLSTPMDWHATMQKLLHLQATTFLECGLSDSLSNLARRNLRGAFETRHLRQEFCRSASAISVCSGTLHDE